MSNLLKFILMVLSCGLLILGSYYGCIQPEYCPDEPQVVEDPPPVAPVDDYAIVSSTGSNDVLTGNKWDAMLQGLLAKYNGDPNQQIEVYGHYYDAEPIPAGFDNMGYLRAGKIKDILVAAGIPADNIIPLSRKLSGTAPADDERWSAGTFNWVAMSDAGEAPKQQLIELDKDNIIVRFPFDKSTKTLASGTEDYLQKLAERIKASGEQVTIVGHTDDVDTEAYNMRLGQQRADFVKSRLTSYGAPAGQITTSSNGENQPEMRGTSAEARRLNRRAVITLIRQQ